MNELGHFAVCLSWFLALFGLVIGILGAYEKNPRIFDSVITSTIFVCIFLSIAIFSLGFGFVNNDYSNQYVWQFSNRDMDWIYKITAIWGGMDGSMLLWAFMLSVSSAIVALRAREYPRILMPWVLSVINSSLLFFITVVVFFTNPFRYIKAPFIPPDGNGLNPLLQNPYMAIHPPLLYLGFTTFSIPFAFCVGALLSGSLSNEWIRLTRRWALVSWGFLTAGITLGGHWAYIELGWGGFWAWDPVENASFLPWLTGTAFLHSVMVQERKSMLKFWNIWLIILTYGLTVFGTFLTRSGVVQSVHAFASTDVGWIFLVYLGLLFGTGVGLTFYRRKELSSEKKIESFFSREAFFLINNLLFLSICFATLWGVMFPVLSEAITGTKQAVGIPFFNAINVPLFLALIFLMGVGPLIAWKKATLSSIGRTFFLPFVLGLLSGVVLLWAGVTEFYPILSYSLSFFVLMTILGEFHRGAKIQKITPTPDPTPIGKGFITLLRRHKTRYGGYIVHLGVLVAAVSITASMAHKTEREFSLSKGESLQIGRFIVTLEDFNSDRTNNYQRWYATASVKDARTGSPITTLTPEMRSYFRNQESTTEVALRMGLREDLYLVLAGFDDAGTRASMKIFINPLQVWLWFGVIIMLIGTGVVLIPTGGFASVEVTDNLERARS